MFVDRWLDWLEEEKEEANKRIREGMRPRVEFVTELLDKKKKIIEKDDEDNIVIVKDAPVRAFSDAGSADTQDPDDWHVEQLTTAE